MVNRKIVMLQDAQWRIARSLLHAESTTSELLFFLSLCCQGIGSAAVILMASVVSSVALVRFLNSLRLVSSYSHHPGVC